MGVENGALFMINNSLEVASGSTSAPSGNDLKIVFESVQLSVSANFTNR